MDEVTPEDYARYLGIGGGGGYYGNYDYAPQEHHSMMSLSNGKGKEEEDETPARSNNSDFVVKKKAKRSVSFQTPSSNSFYGGGNRGSGSGVILREIVRQEPDLTALFDEAGGSTGYDAPIVRSESKRVIPYNVQHGAALLLEAHEDGDIRLTHELPTIRELAACDDEYTEADPSVVIWDTLSTGKCNIYLQEVLPVSYLLLARYLNLDYTVTIMEDVESKPRSFQEVHVEPYTGQRSEGMQTLGCQELVRQRLSKEPKSTWRLVEIYMLRMGPLSPQFVVNDEWLEAQTVAMGKVLTRQSLAPQERAPLGGGAGTGQAE